MNVKKIALYTVLPIFLVILLLVVVPVFVSMDRFKEPLFQQIKKATGRDAKLSSINLSLFPWIGVRLSGLVLKNAEGFSGVPQLTVDSMKIKVKIFPLIFKKVKIKEISVVSPSILIEKKANVFNFSDLTGKQEVKPEKKKKPEGKPESNFLKMVTMDLLSVSRGSIAFQELSSNGKVKTSLEIKDLDISVKDLSPDSTAKFSLSFKVPDAKDQSVKLVGSIGRGWADDFGQALLDISLQISNLNIKNLASLAGVKSAQGVLSTNLFLKGKIAESVESGGEIIFSEFLEGVADKLIVSEDILADFRDNTVTVRKIKVELGTPLLSITGRISNFRKSPELDLSAKSSEIFLKKISELQVFAKKTPKNMSLDGTALLNADIKGGMDNLSLKSAIDFTGAQIFYADIFKKQKGEKLEISADVIKESKFLKIRALALAVKDSRFNIEGTLRLEKPHPSEIRLATTEISLNSIGDLVPKSKGYSPSGKLQLSTALSGPLLNKDQLQVKGSLRLTDLGAGVPGIAKRVEGVDGKISFTRNSINVQSLKASAGETSFVIDTLIKGLDIIAGNFEKPDIDFVLFMPRLNLDELLPKSNVSKKEPVKGEPQPLFPEEFKKVKAKGKVKIDYSKMMNSEMKNLRAEISLKNSKLEVGNLSLEAFNGVCTADLKVDGSAKKPVIASEVHIKNMDSNALISTFNNKTKDTIYGNLFTDLNFNGSGNNGEEIKKSLSGSGMVVVRNGKITSFSMLQQLLGVSKLPADKIKKTPETRFKELKSSVKIENSRIQTNDMTITSDDFNVRAGGSAGFDTSLDYKGEAVLSKDVSDKVLTGVSTSGIGISEIGGVLKDEQGRINVPFIVGGTIKSPKVSLDMAVAKEKAKALVKKKVEAEINKKIKKNLESDKGKELKKKGTEKLKKIFK